MPGFSSLGIFLGYQHEDAVPCMRLGRIAKFTAIVGTMILLVCSLAGCGSSNAAAAAERSAASTEGPSSRRIQPVLTCSTKLPVFNGGSVSIAIRALKAEQSYQDATHHEGWVNRVSGVPTGMGNILAASAKGFAGYGGSHLAEDGARFASDARSFMSDQSSGLIPGWGLEYQRVSNDIHAMARDCGQGWRVRTGPVSQRLPDKWRARHVPDQAVACGGERSLMGTPTSRLTRTVVVKAVPEKYS